MLIPRSVFGISKIAATEPTRYDIHGVHVRRQKGRAIAEATDGMRMIWATWSDTAAAAEFPEVELNINPKKSFAVTLPVSLWNAAAKLAKKISKRAINKNRAVANVGLDEHNTKQGVTLFTHDLVTTQSMTEAALGGKFPGTDAIIPAVSDATHVQVRINPFLLAGLCEAMGQMLDQEDPRSILLSVPKDSNLPIRLDGVNGEDGIETIGVLCTCSA